MAVCLPFTGRVVRPSPFSYRSPDRSSPVLSVPRPFSHRWPNELTPFSPLVYRSVNARLPCCQLPPSLSFRCCRSLTASAINSHHASTFSLSSHCSSTCNMPTGKKLGRATRKASTITQAEAQADTPSPEQQQQHVQEEPEEEIHARSPTPPPPRRRHSGKSQQSQQSQELDDDVPESQASQAASQEPAKRREPKKTII